MTSEADLDRRRAEAVAGMRFRRLAGELHRLGERATVEFLLEVGGQHSLVRTAIETRLSDYVDRLDPETLAALGADDLHPPLHLVPDDGLAAPIENAPVGAPARSNSFIPGRTKGG
jgi:hypothetical protein